MPGTDQRDCGRRFGKTSGRAWLAALAALTVALTAAIATPADAQSESYLDRLPEDEVVYFVLPDRFANGDPANDRGVATAKDGADDPGRLVHGFDPTHKGFYHGGDLKGLTEKLDYIADLGATAIWLGPIYKNKPVQGAPGEESAGYHGYWITDFTDVDPHFGDRDDLKAFVGGAHRRGMKVYLDIITNHTADVIAYRECHDPDYAGPDKVEEGCPYRSKADYPFTTRGPADGAPINADFLGDGESHQTAANFDRLTSPDYAYTPFIPAGEENVKVPAWLNDVSYYHNRGDSAFLGEDSLYGDFAGLDDLMTEDPRVVQGFIDIFKDWISEYRIDGFRVDTAKHVNSRFWRAFIPAIKAHAAAEGIPNFYIFAESYILDGGLLAAQANDAAFQAALDFPLFKAATDVLVDGAPTSRLAERYATDPLFDGGEEMARRLPVFVGNHDAGRFAGAVVKADPEIDDDALYKKIRLAHALLFFGRGAPVIYYGDEQGFTGDGGDQDAREDMFPSRVETYNDNRLAGIRGTTASDNFNKKHPLFRSFARMAALYKKHDALRRGRQIVRLVEFDDGGAFALSRLDAETGEEFLFVMNSGAAQRNLQVSVEPSSSRWSSLVGRCGDEPTAIGSLNVSVAPMEYTLCHGKSR